MNPSRFVNTWVGSMPKRKKKWFNKIKWYNQRGNCNHFRGALRYFISVALYLLPAGYYLSTVNYNQSPSPFFSNFEGKKQWKYYNSSRHRSNIWSPLKSLDLIDFCAIAIWSSANWIALELEYHHHRRHHHFGQTPPLPTSAPLPKKK